jgi:glutamyl/glutaminyl-tRNA synthetase
MLEAFRQDPGNFSHVVRVTGVNWRTARRAWNEGWVPKIAWAPPISAVLEEEAEKARAARYRTLLEQEVQAEQVRIQARADAIAARGEEARGVKLARTNAMNLATIAARAIVAADPLVQELSKRATADLSKVPAEELRKHVAMTLQLSRQASSLLREAVLLERLIAGEPIAVLGVKLDDLSPSQVVDQFERLVRTLQRANAVHAPDVLARALVDQAKGTTAATDALTAGATAATKAVN